MDILSGLLAQTQPKPQSPYATITKLCDRLLHSTLLEDRRAAVLGLKGFSRDYRETVAAGALKGLLLSLQRDREDDETCRATLETLMILFIHEEEGQDARLIRTRNKRYKSPLERGDALTSTSIAPTSASTPTEDYISLWLTDEFTQNEGNIILLIELAKSHDFFIRLYSLQLLSAIIANRPLKAKECIFASPLGISTLVSLLDDFSEVIRNEAILVLTNLVQDHSDIQKLVVFEGTFDKLFKIIELEGGINDGGVVVEDSLHLMTFLLQYNVSNQNHFRETSCAGKLAALIQPHDETEQSKRNLTIVLEITRLFVIESHWNTPSNQQALFAAGVLLNVMRLAFGESTVLSIRTLALLTAADLIRGNSSLQAEFFGIDVPYVDLSIAVNTKRQPEIIPVTEALLKISLLSTSIYVFDLRVGAALCLAAAFDSNAEAKTTFLTEQINTYRSKTGGLLLSALVDYDPDIKWNPYKVWFATSLLMDLLKDSQECSNLLRTFSVSGGDQGEEDGDVSEEDKVLAVEAMTGNLISSIRNILIDDPRITIAYLMLLTYWLYDEPEMVNAFLQESSALKSLISLVNGNLSSNKLVEPIAAVLLGVVYDFSSSHSPVSRVDIYNLLTNTIGRDQYVLKVARLKELPVFKEYEPFEHLFTEDKDDTGLPRVFLDQTYVTLIKENISRMQRSFDRDPNSEPNSKISLEMYDDLQLKAQEVTKELESLKSKESLLHSEHASLQVEHETLQRDYGELKKVHDELDARFSEVTKSLEENARRGDGLETELNTAISALEKLKAEHEVLISKESQQSGLAESYKKDKEKAEAGINKMTKELMGLTKEVSTLEKAKKDMQKSLDQLEGERKKVIELEELKEKMTEKLRSAVDQIQGYKSEVQSLSRELNEAKIRLKKSEAIKGESSAELKELKGELVRLKGEMESHSSKYEALKSQLKAKEGELEVLQGEVKVKDDELKKKDSELLEKVNEVKLIEGKVKEKDFELEKKANEVKVLEKKANQVKVLEDKLKAKEEELKASKPKEGESKMDTSELNQQISTLKNELEQKQKDLESSQEQLKSSKSVNVEFINKVKSLKSENESLKKEVDSCKKGEGEMVPKSDIDDLMLILADMEESKNNYKQKLKALGGDVSEEDDDDDDDEEDED